MEPKEAYVFQHRFSGLQLFVYHKSDLASAEAEIYKSMPNAHHWLFIGKKIATSVSTD